MVATSPPLAWFTFAHLLCYLCTITNGGMANWTITDEKGNVDEKIPYERVSTLIKMDPNSLVLSTKENENSEGRLHKFSHQSFGDLRREIKQGDEENLVLIRVVPVTLEQLVFLQSVKRKGSDEWIQFWRDPDSIHRHVDFWISPKNFKKHFAKLLPHLNIHYQIIDKVFTDNENPFPFSMKNIENFNNVFHSFNELRSEMLRLVNVYDDVLSAEVIGKSFEGRPIHVSNVRVEKTKQNKPIIFILCGSHPREWLAVSSCQYVLRRLVFDQKYDNDVIKLLQHYNVAMVPMLNPDGYVYTQERQRLWRKNRSANTRTFCRGVDLSRNFNIRWGTWRTSFHTCSDSFCGNRPFSESETLALGRYIHKLRKKIVAFLDVHTYGQMWMSPWGFTKHYPKDYKNQESAMRKIHKAIKKETGQNYKYGRLSTTLYRTSGSVTDWVYNMFRIIHTYSVELRPEYGTRINHFERSPTETIPSGRDLFTGLKTLAAHMMQEKESITNAM